MGDLFISGFLFNAYDRYPLYLPKKMPSFIQVEHWLPCHVSSSIPGGALARLTNRSAKSCSIQQSNVSERLMVFTQLNPPIPLHVIGKGDGYALAVIDYSPEHNLIWVTALNDSGEIWCAPNPIVRLDKNWTLGRKSHGKAGDQSGGPAEADC